MTKQSLIKKTIDRVQKDETITEKPETKTVRINPLSKLSREVSDKDLRNKAVVRLILNLNDQLEEEIQEIRNYREKYYNSDKRVGILETQIDSININFIFIALGSILIGFTPSLWDKQNFFWIMFLVGIAFFLIGFFKKPKSNFKSNAE